MHVRSRSPAVLRDHRALGRVAMSPRDRLFGRVDGSMWPRVQRMACRTRRQAQRRPSMAAVRPSPSFPHQCDLITAPARASEARRRAERRGGASLRGRARSSGQPRRRPPGSLGIRSTRDAPHHDANGDRHHGLWDDLLGSRGGYSLRNLCNGRRRVPFRAATWNPFPRCVGVRGGRGRTPPRRTPAPLHAIIAAVLPSPSPSGDMARASCNCGKPFRSATTALASLLALLSHYSLLAVTAVG